MSTDLDTLQEEIHMSRDSEQESVEEIREIVTSSIDATGEDENGVESRSYSDPEAVLEEIYKILHRDEVQVEGQPSLW